MLKTLRDTEPVIYRGQVALVRRSGRTVFVRGEWNIEWPAAKSLLDLVDATEPTGGPPFMVGLSSKAVRQN